MSQFLKILFTIYVYYISSTAEAMNFLDASDTISNVRPKYTSVFHIDVPKDFLVGKGWEDVRQGQMVSFVNDFFLKRNFTRLPRGHYSVYPETTLSIYGKIQDKNLIDCVAVHIQCFEYSLAPHLKERQKIYSPKENLLNYIPPMIIEGPWDYINFSLSFMHRNYSQYTDFKKQDERFFCELFYKNIQEKGLENFLHRISVVGNANSSCSFNALYSKEGEKEKNKKLLKGLMNNEEEMEAE